MLLTPLRYPGGKSQYIGLIEQFAEKIEFDRYVEPFAGGSAVALHFAINRHIPVVVNDKDPAIYAFWKSITEKTDQFIDEVENTEINIDTWKNCRQIVDNKKYANIFKLGFATFFLNRTNFSGCINAGPIGGLQQNGKYKMDVRFNKPKLIDRIKIIAEHKEYIDIKNMTATELMDECNHRDYVYLDPPYFGQGKHLYDNYLDNNGHYLLSQVLFITSANWLMSYDKCGYIQSLYKHHIISQESIRYSFNSKIKKNELLIANWKPTEEKSGIIRSSV